MERHQCSPRHISFLIMPSLLPASTRARYKELHPLTAFLRYTVTCQNGIYTVSHVMKFISLLSRWDKNMKLVRKPERDCAEERTAVIHTRFNLYHRIFFLQFELQVPTVWYFKLISLKTERSDLFLTIAK